MDIKQQFFDRFLRELFHRRGEGFVLKGGVALSVLFEPHRLTKDIDLDFTNPKRTADSLHRSIERALESAARAIGIRDLRVATPGKSERTPRWKVNFSDAAGRQHHIEIEVSRSADRAPPGSPIQVRYRPRAAVGTAPFWVDTYDVPTLIATKLVALLGRTVPAPRDVYDLDKLATGAPPVPAASVEWALQRAGVAARDALELARDRLKAMGWDEFRSELLDALPTAEAERIDALEWDAIKERVADYLTELLT